MPKYGERLEVRLDFPSETFYNPSLDGDTLLVDA